MTERFSPTYIAFILSDEASVLQEGHEWQTGDWFLYLPTGDWHLVCGDAIAMALNEPCDDKHLWLPTLTDLLDMIEEAGWRWRVEMLTPRPGVRTETCYVTDAERGEPGEREYEEMTEQQRLLAAAKLAVRVLEKETK